MVIVRACLRDDDHGCPDYGRPQRGPVAGRMNSARIDAMTDADIARAVADDPDAAPLLSDEQLANMKVVWPTEIAATRRRLGLSQTEFAAWLGTSPGAFAQLGAVPPRARRAGARAAPGDRARAGGGAAGDWVSDVVMASVFLAWCPIFGDFVNRRTPTPEILALKASRPLRCRPDQQQRPKAKHKAISST